MIGGGRKKVILMDWRKVLEIRELGKRMVAVNSWGSKRGSRGCDLWPPGDSLGVEEDEREEKKL